MIHTFSNVNNILYWLKLNCFNGLELLKDMYNGTLVIYMYICNINYKYNEYVFMFVGIMVIEIWGLYHSRD